MIQGLILTNATNKIEFYELKFLESMNYEKRKLFVYLLGCGRRNLECLNADKDCYGPKYHKRLKEWVSESDKERNKFLFHSLFRLNTLTTTFPFKIKCQIMLIIV